MIPLLISSGYSKNIKLHMKCDLERIKAQLQYNQEKKGTWDFRTWTALLWAQQIKLVKLVLLCVCSSHLTMRWWLFSSCSSTRLVFISFRKYSHWACITLVHYGKCLFLFWKVFKHHTQKFLANYLWMGSRLENLTTQQRKIMDCY